jgi:hypothetical protein
MQKEYKDWGTLKKVGYWILVTPLLILLAILAIPVILGLIGGLMFGWGNSF